jgi:hypothetical protein
MKVIQSVLLSVALLASPVSAADTKQETIKAGVSTVGAGAVGYIAVEASGLTAMGLVGPSAAFGMALGPVGAGVGALIGLAGYGLYRVFAK